MINPKKNLKSLNLLVQTFDLKKTFPRTKKKLTIFYYFFFQKKMQRKKTYRLNVLRLCIFKILK